MSDPKAETSAVLVVIPAKAGIHFAPLASGETALKVDSRLRGNDSSRAEALP